MFWTWPRPWVMATMLSERVSVHFSGRPSFRAAAAVMANSAYMPALAPKPPPTAGATTRTRSSSSPTAPASGSRTPCGFWVGTWAVNASSPSGWTRMPFGSIGTGASRWFTNLPVTTTSASSRIEGSSPKLNSMARFEPCSGNTAGASSASAASGSTTVSNGS